MRIGIKYCGGCNPRYDRKQAVEKLADRMTGMQVETAREDGQYDVVLLVCGCTAQCIRKWRIAGTGRYIMLPGEEAFERLTRQEFLNAVK